MAITKVAARFRSFDNKVYQYLSRLISPAWKKNHDYAADPRAVKITRGVARPFIGMGKGLYSVGRKAAVLGAKGITSYGKALYNSPKTTIPGTIVAGMGAYHLNNMSERMRKNFYHSDPNMNYTKRSPTGIKYYNPEFMQHKNEHTNFLF